MKLYCIINMEVNQKWVPGRHPSSLLEMQIVVVVYGQTVWTCEGEMAKEVKLFSEQLQAVTVIAQSGRFY